MKRKWKFWVFHLEVLVRPKGEREIYLPVPDHFKASVLHVSCSLPAEWQLLKDGRMVASAEGSLENFQLARRIHFQENSRIGFRVKNLSHTTRRWNKVVVYVNGLLHGQH